MSRIPLDSLTGDLRARVDARLRLLAPDADEPPEAVHRAVRYSLLGPGKRVRPMVTVLATAHFGGRTDLALDPACAVEMVHTASLILDDLPSMDDGMMRRGRPTVHRVFGEGTAQLAAMALLNQAFAVLCRAPGIADALRIRLVAILTEAIGSRGLIAGQSRDLAGATPGGTLGDHEETNLLKTAALFVAAAEIGARIAGVGEGDVDRVRRFGRNFGLAFQLIDDVLDVSATPEAAGKDVSQDGARATAASVLGVATARTRARAFIEASVSELQLAPDTLQPLAALAISLQRHP